jgi:hypothetical protein
VIVRIGEAHLGGVAVATPVASVADGLRTAGKYVRNVTVRLSREIITLLSEQLYQSPSKAIEELVINSFDADAAKCYVLVPAAALGTSTGRLPLIAVYDNGSGMDAEGLADLWRVGKSNKREQAIEAIRKRRQIGKFGIGKLATYALADSITYITSTGNNDILTVSLSFNEFKSDPEGPDQPVELPVRALIREEVLVLPHVSEALEAAGLEPAEALDPASSWTLVLLEDFKEAAQTLSPGRLGWVLRTAMPLSKDFEVYLNREPVISSKADYKLVADFAIVDLPESRINAISSKTGHTWSLQKRPAPPHLGKGVEDEVALVCDLFEEGIFGKIIVAERPIYGGKSDDLIRSNGFFIRVRGRLVNENDELFGLPAQSHEVWNRFRADIDADDLDEDLTAPREGVGLSQRRVMMLHVLTEVFNEARSRYVKWSDARNKSQETKREPDRNYVDPRNVERPVADVLTQEDSEGTGEGSDADEAWFYLDVPHREDIDDVTTKLYEADTREPYEYLLESRGRSERMVQFVPGEQKFIINEDHELVMAFKDDPRSLDLLYDVATAEALLEVYLRDVGLPPHLAGEILERRDILLRSLAREKVTSASAIAADLRNSVASEHDLEIGLVVAARALGFVAKHLSGADNPDGVARLRDYPLGEQKITLEAKSSAKVPSLGAIDFAGLVQHVADEEAQGCLLVAPDYPGGARHEDAAAAKRAVEGKISCWTVEQLARVVEEMESRYITARHILDIVLTTFAPEDVTARVEALLAEPSYAARDLARAIVAALRSLETYGPPDMVRSFEMIMPELARAGVNVPAADARTALQQLAAASQGAMTITRNDRLRLNTSIEELERRVEPWLKGAASPRRASTFRVEDLHPDVS